jgi:hypothetical protein
VLAEIKVFFKRYAIINGKYEEVMAQVGDRGKDSKEPETTLMKLLCPLLTGRNLRTIIREPKRLVWVAVNKEALESLVLKIEDLNSLNN